MKIVTLNLRHGGGKRIGKLIEYLIGAEADAIVCTEFRSNKEGERLRSALEDEGFRDFHISKDKKAREGGKRHYASAPPEKQKIANRVAIATRQTSRLIKVEPAPVDNHRIVGCVLDGLFLLGVYFDGLKGKASLFDYLLAGQPDHPGDRLLIGDFNTGRHHMDEAGATFNCADRFERLESVGYVDLWRREHGEDAREYTWKAPQENGGYFRLDHAFGSVALAQRLDSCEYDHTTRENGLSDHSAMTVEIAPPGGKASGSGN